MCDKLAIDIWDFCSSRKIWISAAHIPGVENTIADKLSRIFNDKTEWKLSPNIDNKIVKKFRFRPCLDLFASRLNHQIDQYVSWQLDPYSVTVDAFTISWTNRKLYAHPFFILVGATLSKIIKDKLTGIMIIPEWPTQYWYPIMMNLLIANPAILPQFKTLITLPFNPTARHPLFPKMKVCNSLIRRYISNSEFSDEVKEFIMQSWRSSTRAKYNFILSRWEVFCSKRKEDSLQPSAKSILDFLFHLYEEGYLYSGICAARSALSAVINLPGYTSLSAHPMITRFLKGIYNRHPSLSHYIGIWDLNRALDLYKSLPDNGHLQLKDITLKLAMLFILLGARRKQTCSILIENINITDIDLVLIPNVVQKHTKPGKPLKPILHKKFSHNSELCVVQCMQIYLEIRRKVVSKDMKPLFIT